MSEPHKPTYPMAAALADWIVEIRWALESCHEHVGTNALKRITEKESTLLAVIDQKEHR